MPESPYVSPVEQLPKLKPVDPSIRRVCIKQIDPMSAGITLGRTYAFIGIIIGGVMFLMTLVGAGSGGGAEVLFMGGGAVIFLPIFYGIAGFIGGILSALVYNAVSGMAGGIQMKLEIK